MGNVISAVKIIGLKTLPHVFMISRYIETISNEHQWTYLVSETLIEAQIWKREIEKKILKKK